MKPGLHIVVTIAESACDNVSKEEFTAVNTSIANISCERSLLVNISNISKPSYTWTALKLCLAVCLRSLRLYADQA